MTPKPFVIPCRLGTLHLDANEQIRFANGKKFKDGTRGRLCTYDSILVDDLTVGGFIGFYHDDCPRIAFGRTCPESIATVKLTVAKWLSNPRNLKRYITSVLDVRANADRVRMHSAIKQQARTESLRWTRFRSIGAFKDACSAHL